MSAALLLGQPLAAIVVAIMYAGGTVLEDLARGRAERSLRALTDVAEKKGYVLVGTNITGANAFFVRKELAEGLFTEIGQVDRLYNPPRYWLIADHYQYVGHPADFGSYVDLE